MPIYDYVCESCGHVLEVVHGLHAEGPRECPQCGGPMSKAFSAPTFHFKGSGWAKKDRKSVSGPVKPRPQVEGGGSDATSGPSGSSGTAEATGTSAPSATASGQAGSDAAKEG